MINSINRIKQKLMLNPTGDYIIQAQPVGDAIKITATDGVAFIATSLSTTQWHTDDIIQKIMRWGAAPKKWLQQKPAISKDMPSWELPASSFCKAVYRIKLIHDSILSGTLEDSLIDVVFDVTISLAEGCISLEYSDTTTTATCTKSAQQQTIIVDGEYLYSATQFLDEDKTLKIVAGEKWLYMSDDATEIYIATMRKKG